MHQPIAYEEEANRAVMQTKNKVSSVRSALSVLALVCAKAVSWQIRQIVYQLVAMEFVDCTVLLSISCLKFPFVR